ncbi:hypothetical protein ES703_67033 [subsurface metagenome]
MFLDGVSQLASVMEGDVFAVCSESIRQAFCIIHYLVHRRFEPLFDVPVDQVAGKKEQEESGDERQGDEEQDQLRFKMSANDLSFSFQVEFC